MSRNLQRLPRRSRCSRNHADRSVELRFRVPIHRRPGNGRVPADAFGANSIASASPATVGAAKSRTSGSSTEKTSRTLDISRNAKSEFPPASKKSSFAPTRSTPSTFDQTSASRISVSVRGDELAAVGRAAPIGDADHFAVDFPTGRRRQFVQGDERGRNHVGRQPFAGIASIRASPELRPAGRPCTPPGEGRRWRPVAPRQPPPGAATGARAALARLPPAQLGNRGSSPDCPPRPRNSTWPSARHRVPGPEEPLAGGTEGIRDESAHV